MSQLSQTHRHADIPFLWRASDGLGANGKLVARSFGTEMDAVFARTSPKRFVDANGILRVAPYGVPAFGVVNGEHAFTPEITRINLCLRSEDFGTSWGTFGTVSRVAAAHTASGVTLDLLGDTDVTALSNYAQTVTITGDGEKAFSFHIKKGSAALTVVKLRAIGVADRGRIRVTWSGETPVINASVGSYLGYEAMKDGTYRVLAVAAGVVATDSNSIQVYPAGDEAIEPVGTAYVGGMQVENALAPSSYIPTVASTVQRSADIPYFTLPAGLGINAPLTLYARFIERGGVRIANGRVLAIGESATNVNGFRIIASGTNYGSIIADAAGATLGSSSTAATPIVGQAVELRTVLSTTVQQGQSLDGAAEVMAAASGAYTLPTAWGSGTPKFFFGTSDMSGSNQAGVSLTHIAMAFGVRTRDEMRTLVGR